MKKFLLTTGQWFLSKDIPVIHENVWKAPDKLLQIAWRLLRRIADIFHVVTSCFFKTTFIIVRSTVKRFLPLGFCGRHFACVSHIYYAGHVGFRGHFA
jgi:hypothetical protein